MHVLNVSVYVECPQGATALLFSWLCIYHFVSAGLILIGPQRSLWEQHALFQQPWLAHAQDREVLSGRRQRRPTGQCPCLLCVDVVLCFVSAISHPDIPMCGRCDSLAGLSCFALVRARPHSCSFAQGLTMGSMWYDAGTNGSWAVSSHHSSAMHQSFQ